MQRVHPLGILGLLVILVGQCVPKGYNFKRRQSTRKVKVENVLVGLVVYPAHHLSNPLDVTPQHALGLQMILGIINVPDPRNCGLSYLLNLLLDRQSHNLANLLADMLVELQRTQLVPPPSLICPHEVVYVPPVTVRVANSAQILVTWSEPIVK
ncbi:hypothetical protein BCR44DRAFT_1432534 [Catenaria anguillulae PL171]|uniref:Fibronectin type-III domain-containing protein n=1 Tax=Catenaria anguillulae PL171 TaxID=765915 RepID=A0A1Y2HP50_9FUNG|nr:hypothetical protein BCR44DRAFT_1432534 [Catenaria anguillulae PL171]